MSATSVRMPGPGVLEQLWSHPLITVTNLALAGWANLRWQMYRHPWISRLAFLLVLWMIAMMLGAQQAMAADNGSTSPYGFAGPVLKDSAGVPVGQYLRLPIDRGDVWTFQKTLVSFPTELIWAGHVFYVTWMIAVVQYILSFEWANTITAPLNAIAEGLQGLIAQFNFIPFFFFLAAFITGLMMLRGKIASGLIEFSLAVILSILATGIMSNPVATITGPDGAITKTQQWGGEIAVAITSTPIKKPGESTPPAPPQRPGQTVDAKDVLNATISAELVDAFIRIPAQTISFGYALTGKCGQVFDEQMKAKDPRKEETAVRDKVGECDPAAKNFVQNPSGGMVINALIVAAGSGILNLFVVVLAGFFVFSIFSTCWNGLKSMVQVVKGILPGLARTGFWYSIAGMGTSLLMLVFALMFLAGYLKLVVAALELTSGIGMVMQMTLVTWFIIIGLGMLFVIRSKAKKAGESLGERLSRIGMNTKEREAKRTPVRNLASAALPMLPFAVSAMTSKKPTLQRRPVLAGAAGSSGGLADMGEQFRSRPAGGGEISASPTRLALTSFEAGPDSSGGPRPGPKGRPPKMGPSSNPGVPESVANPMPNPVEESKARTARRRSKVAGFVATAATFIPGGGAVVTGGKIAAKAAAGVAERKAERASAQASGPGDRTTGPRISVSPNGQGSVDNPLVGRVIYSPPPVKQAPNNKRRATQTAQAVRVAQRLNKLRQAVK